MRRLDYGYLSIDQFLFWSQKQLEAFPKGEFSATNQMKGAFQPLRDMLKDAIDTFKPYRSGWFVKRDAKQPADGLENILKGVFELVASPLLFLFYPIYYAFRAKNLKEYTSAIGILWLLSLSWFINGALSVLRGVTQIAATPLTWFVKMPLRGFQTWVRLLFGEEFSTENNPGVKRLVKRARELIQEKGSDIEDEPSNYQDTIDLIENIHQKIVSGSTKEQFIAISQEDYKTAFRALLKQVFFKTFEDNNEQEIPIKESIENYLNLFPQ